MGLRHLLWIPAAALLGFTSSFVFADILVLPLDVYYGVYFASVAAFTAFYTLRTRFELSTWIRRRLMSGIVAGIAVGALLVRGVLAQPGTPALTGGVFWWALFWRGVVYGFVDGVLLISLPWVITWRAFRADAAGTLHKIAVTMAAWIAITIVTTAYHLGYADFRSSKIVQPNIGATIAALSSFVTRNPAASPISHVFLHVTAVIRSPGSDLFLPPHRH
jgi:hypothetical protein